MRRKRFSSGAHPLFTGLLLMLGLTASAMAGQKKILYTFTGGQDGGYPTYPGLIFDDARNLYGTTNGGGIGPQGGFGTVFELKPKADGSWKERVLYRFAGHRDGAFPSSGLIFDKSGNLYGVTSFGGGRGWCPIVNVNYFCGTVFELKRGGNGQWTEIVLRRFDNGIGGGMPFHNLILDERGNLYGTAVGGKGCRQNDCGVVFRLTPTKKREWNEKVLYTFHGSDGGGPGSPLLFDAKGNLYGVTAGGGPRKQGLVFKLEPTRNGPWKETILHYFNPFENYDGSGPCGFLTFDSAGNLYGSTQHGGRYSCGGLGCGMVYKLDHDTWTESTVFALNGHNFKGLYNDEQGVAFDASGNLYGTASGSTLYPGGIFELIPQADGSWREHTISRFPANSAPGMAIYGNDGNLYGVTDEGGAYKKGTVFQITP